jgi:co-chaperonin GroES (HSP10)
VVPGDHVLFGKYAGAEIRIADEKLRVMQETGIPAVLEDCI